MSTPIEVKKTVDSYLDEVDYSDLDAYVPTPFALKYVSFVKLVNGGAGESHPSPVVHMKMLDKLTTPKNRLANLCARGLAKTTLFGEYLIPFVAVFEGIEGFDNDIDGLIYVSDSMENGVKSLRKNLEYRYNNSDFLQYWLPREHCVFTDSYLEFRNRNGHRLGVRMFGAKTGLRGTKIFGKRPKLGILDDLVSDDDANSKAAMEAIRNTVYRGIDYALDPTKRKIVFNGTPFNKGDILYEAVESGGWEVNVWPVCERFPVPKEEFRGAWPERFSYEFVRDQYDLSVQTGQVASFMQELMLRINSDDERVIKDQDIRWYSRKQLLDVRSHFNYYITTDFSTSDKESADNSVICVWAYNNNGDWFLVDISLARRTMDVSLDELFRLVAMYRPMNVGIEVTGQQGGFIPWIQQEMMNRNVFFTLATHNNGKNPGIRPQTNKLTRFQMVVPWFKSGKIFLPEEMRTNKGVVTMVEELSLVTPAGFKSKHDDTLDNISQLPLLGAWKPSEEVILIPKDGRWELQGFEDEDSTVLGGMGSYIV